jgi:hypothetical protein
MAGETEYISPITETAKDSFDVPRNLATADHLSDRQTHLRLWTEFTRFRIGTEGYRGMF